jgi:hypothetical protein
MRIAPLLSTILVLLAPCTEGASPIVPTIALTLTPSDVNVNASTEKDVQVEFQGTVTVDKPPMVRVVATLEGSVDTGWVVALDPNTFVFTMPGTQQFSCKVIVPQNATNMTGTLAITGRAMGGGLQSDPASVTAVINVTGTGPVNLTADNRTGGSGGTRTGGTNILTLSIIFVGIIMAAVGGFIVYRAKKK